MCVGMGADQQLFHARRVLCDACLFVFVLLLPCTFAAHGAVNVLTYHNDNARSGVNTNETLLTLINVNTTSFGKLFDCPVDGFAYAQPLVVTNVTIPGKGVHNVVFVATEHDSVFAFDADAHSGSNAVPLWKTSFVNPAAGISSVPSADMSCTVILPEIGITSTPVIDPASGTIYVEAKTKEVTNNIAGYYHRLHALDISTGAEKFGGPVLIMASVPGNGEGNDGAGMVPFDAFYHLNRPGLLLNNGIIYIAFASHCDHEPYHGWLFGYGAQTLGLSNVFNVTPNGGLGGIWQAGCGPSADTNGNVYISTGNGAFGTSFGNYGDSFIKLSTTNGLQVADYFAPFNQSHLDEADIDLGSGGVLLLPDDAGSVSHPHLMVSAGKEGRIYLLDRDNLGQFNPIDDSQIVESFTNAGGCYDTPAYFNQWLYYCGQGSPLLAFQLTNATIVTTPIAQSTNVFGYPGPTPCISANGTNDAIVWTIQSQGAGNQQPAVLRAYNATNIALELYDSAQADSGIRDYAGSAVKFTVPTIANGKVYVGAQYNVAVFGNGTFLATPTISPAGATFTNSITVTLADITPGAQIFYTLDDTVPSTNSIPYSAPFALTNTASFRARAFLAGAVDSTVASATFLSLASIGQGSGLTAEYYSQQFVAYTNPPTVLQTDATVNVDWNGNAPVPGVSSENFTVRWSGAVQPQFSEVYNFYTVTDDGVRLWVNGQLVVDAWIGQGATEWSGSIPLTAGVKYPITMEYFQLGGGSSARLLWSSPSIAKSVIPQSQLYPVGSAGLTVIPADGTNQQLQVQLSGLVGKNYVLQCSSNLVDWVDIVTNITPPDRDVFVPPPTVIFTNLNTTDCDNKFYRAVQMP